MIDVMTFIINKNTNPKNEGLFNMKINSKTT